ncbi:MAG TPA: PHP-associated domain-containing protein [Terriglobia bacterium]|nr:PHP-associated domain-containing protein [Terriglobia bacterium]
MRCDLHVHSVHSGMCTLPALKGLCRESYSPPEAVYNVLRRRGMNLVTLTDHDSIDGAEALRSRPDFFLSEEVTCTAPSGAELHVGVYGITERQHLELQRRRTDLPRFVAYMGEERLFAAVNHPFSALTGRRRADDYEHFRRFRGLEVLNAHLPRTNNRLAERLATRESQVAVGGSDAHTVESAGSAWTEVPGARSPGEYLAGLRRGRGRVAGRSGTYSKLTRDVLRIAAALMREKRWTCALAPLLVAVPLFTLANLAIEHAFARKWGHLIIEGTAQPEFATRNLPAEDFVA